MGNQLTSMLIIYMLRLQCLKSKVHGYLYSISIELRGLPRLSGYFFTGGDSYAGNCGCGGCAGGVLRHLCRDRAQRCLARTVSASKQRRGCACAQCPAGRRDEVGKATNNYYEPETKTGRGCTDSRKVRKLLSGILPAVGYAVSTSRQRFVALPMVS